MQNLRTLFKTNLAQTSDIPLMLEIERAEGVFLFDTSGKKYLDLISGISVSNIGHQHPQVVKAVKDQADKHLYLMVYGEYIQSPQVQYAELLVKHLPPSLNNVYFVNSGSEAVEGALKLAKRFTGRAGIVSFKKAYHGSTHGALSVIGDESFKRPYRPLLPGISTIEFNDEEALGIINKNIAAVVIEPVQAEAGVRKPGNDFLKKVRNRCNETGTLMILDEIQTGMGRTGSLFAFEQYNIIPDILLLAKSLGGGLPLGAFIASKKIMNTLKENPVLGHITTFGGHPLSCAAGKAAMEVILSEKLAEQIADKEKIFKKELSHPAIKEIRSKGLLVALEFKNFEINKQIIDQCIEKGVITDWFLFADNCLRIAPPLTISESEIREACGVIMEAVEECV